MPINLFYRTLSLLTTLLILAATVGCSTGKITTTERSAVEMALISESVSRTLTKLTGPTLYYQRAYIDDSELEAPDKTFIVSSLRLHLGKMGMHVVDDKDQADVIIHPRAAIAAMDDSSFLLGIPEIPIPIPGSGTVHLPEVAFFKRNKQIGVNRMGLYGIDAKDNSLAFDMGNAASTAYYTRWSLLIFISFRTTDLSAPYKGEELPTY